MKNATSVDTSNLASKRNLITLKDNDGKLDVSKFVNAPTGLNNLKTEVDHLYVDKLKTVFVNLRKLSDKVSKEVAKNTKFNKTNMKVNNLVNKIPDVSILTQTNQYNTEIV